MLYAAMLLHKTAARGHRVAAAHHDQAARHFMSGNNIKAKASALTALSAATEALMHSLKGKAACEALGQSRQRPSDRHPVSHVVIFEIYERGGIWSVLRDGRFFGNFLQRAYAEDIVDAAIQRTVDGGGQAERLPTVQSN